MTSHVDKDSHIMPHDPNEADEAILDLLLDGRERNAPWGRQLPKNIARELDYSRQYVQNRLQILSAAGFVENIGGGLYEIQPAGVTRDPDVDEEESPSF